MIKHNHAIKLIILLAADITLLYGSLLAAIAFRYWPDYSWPLIDHTLPFSLIFAVWLLFFGAFGLYDLRFTKNTKLFLYRLIYVMAVNVILAILILYLIPLFQIEPRRNLLAIAGLATFTIALWRTIFNHLIARTPSSRLLFFGLTPEAIELIDYLLANPQLGQRPIGVVLVNGEAPDTLPVPHFTSPADLEHIARDFAVDTIVASSEIKGNKTFVALLLGVIPQGIAVAEFPKFYEGMRGKIPLSLIGEVWFLENLIGAKKEFYEFFKRIFDILVGFLIAIPTIFLFPFIAALIKLDSGGKIFFIQERIGRGGRQFRLIKFRSMVQDAETIGGHKGEGRDPRHTRVGTLLRKNYLDELPQVINILKGEMSFIGPRPERPEFVEELKKKIPFYEMRLLVPPGLTGWAQTNMENDASVEDAPEKMQYDLYYIKNRSAILDLLIALRTIFTLIQREGR